MHLLKQDFYISNYIHVDTFFLIPILVPGYTGWMSSILNVSCILMGKMIVDEKT